MVHMLNHAPMLVTQKHEASIYQGCFALVHVSRTTMIDMHRPGISNMQAQLVPLCGTPGGYLFHQF